MKRRSWAAKPERNAEILKRYQAGQSAPSLAKAFGVTNARIYQIVERFMKVELLYLDFSPDMAQLSTRARNVLLSMGVHAYARKDEAAELLSSLAGKHSRGLMAYKNMGRHTLAEITSWLDGGCKDDRTGV
jgi:hypothetical protein